MRRWQISTGSPFEEKAGYARAVVQETREGVWVFVAGTTGYDYDSMTMPSGVAEQARNALATIERTLAKAEVRRQDIVRVNYILPDAGDCDEVFAVTGAHFADAPPSATMVIAGLIDPAMRVEIEATAFRPRQSAG